MTSPITSSHLITQQDAIARILELEAELNEFQESSRDLELALETELHQLEQANQKLEFQRATVAQQLISTSQEVQRLKRELSDTIEALRLSEEQHETQIKSLRQTLVAVEIANDSMEDNDRVLQSQLQIAQQLNNELLEKLALVESDLQQEQRHSKEKLLHLQNQELELARLREINSKLALGRNSKRMSRSAKVESRDFTAEFGADELFLSMREVLKTGPPAQKRSTIPKSDLLKKLHQLTEKSEELSSKAGTLKLALVPGGLKLPSTTSITHTEKRQTSAPIVRVRVPPEMSKPPEKSKPSEISKLETIEGSPIAHRMTLRPTKLKRRGGILDSLRALAG